MKKTLGITALVFVLCVTLVGCGGEETHNQDANAGTSIESPLSAASSEIQPLEKANDFENGTIEFFDYGISCKVPSSWVRTDTNDFTYFYPQPPTNTFMMVGFSETSSSVFDSGALDGFVNGVGSGQEFFSEISREEKTTSDGTRYMYVTTSGIIKEVGIASQIALFDGDGGIIMLSMANSTDALKDYRADFENVVNSASVAVASGHEETNNDLGEYSPSKSDIKYTGSESGGALLNLADSLGSCVGDGEHIASVTLDDKVLKIVVDLSHADLGFLSIDDLAYSRASSITDEILNHSELDSSWDRINLDFGTTGRIEIGKDAIKTNEYGMRYMDSAKFKLQ